MPQGSVGCPTTPAEAAAVQALTALCKLAANNDANRERIGAEGGVGVVLAAMKAHAEAERVQEQGCCWCSW